MSLAEPSISAGIKMNSYEVLPTTMDRKTLLKCESSGLGSNCRGRGGGGSRAPRCLDFPSSASARARAPERRQLSLAWDRGPDRKEKTLSCPTRGGGRGGGGRGARPHLLPRGPPAVPPPLSSAGCLPASPGFSRARGQTLSISSSVSLSPRCSRSPPAPRLGWGPNPRTSLRSPGSGLHCPW